jgi:putative redox protein
MQTKIRFQASGEQTLSGVLHQPDAGKPSAYAVFAHCFTCTKNIKAAVHIAEALSDVGIAVLRFDFTGLGQSEGEFAATNFSSNVEDLLAAADFLTNEHSAPSILVGHSLGGTACLAAASHMDSVRAVATIGSPADAEHILGLIEDDIETIEKQGEAKVNLGGVPFTLRKDFVDNVRAQSVRDGIGKLRRALLVMHSPVDAVVSIDEATHIYTSAKHPKSFVSLDDADHLLSRESDSRYAGSVLAAWAMRYLDTGLEPLPEAPFKEDEVTVLGRMNDAFRLSINAAGHRLVGDEPEDHGGADSGPSPYEFLSAALGSCTVMTLNMYARHKKLALDSVQVDIKHGKIHATDCGDCETREGKIDQFERIIKLKGDLSEEQRNRLLEIADRCPVHRTLHSEISINSRLVDD